MSARARAGLVCFIAGIAFAAAAAVGVTRLVVAGRGFLSATALLLSLALAAVAAGAWGGAPELAQRTSARRRTLWLTLALLLAAGYLLWADIWLASRALSGAGAIAAMLLLAAPGYAAGALFVALAEHERALAPAALFGSACGVLLTAGVLIPLFHPWAALLLASGITAIAVPLAPGARTRTREEDMHGRVIIVTGAGRRGQAGFAIAAHLHAAGAHIVMTSRNDDVHALAREIGPDETVVAVEADLAGDEGPAAVVATARDRFGRIDGLVNAAGGLTLIASVESTTPEQWHAELQRNAETTFRMSRAALPLLRESRGAIVNFASPAAFHAPASLSAYGAAKAAVVAFTHALAVEERDNGVRVNAIAPGMMDTEQNRQEMPDGRFVSRRDVAEVVAFLLSEAGRGVTGETIRVLGGTID